MSTARNDLPPIAPDALAQVLERAPPRLTKKLDAAPDVAGAWSWERAGDALVVTTDGGERVTLTSAEGAVRAADAITCTCLLSPRCFHVLAAASYLELAEAEPADTEAVDAREAAGSAGSPVQSGRDAAPHPEAAESERRAIARTTSEALARAVEVGLSALGALERAELLRSVHAARVAGLHRLASRTLAFTEAGRALRERSATFELGQALRSLGDAAVTARRIARGSTERDVIGVARRAYEDIGAKRFVGVACEPVLTRSGYAGVVTYVVDEAGELFTVQDVAPGDAGRALASYRATLRLGEASLTHKELSRAGLFVQGATASSDRRLGSGARVSAVSATGATFEEEPLAALFRVPFAEQLERARAASNDVESGGPALLFVRGTLVGPAPFGARFAVAPPEPPGDRGVADDRAELHTVVTLAMPSADDAFACNENLRVLRAAIGTRVHVVAKLDRRRPGVLEALTIGALDGSLAVADESKARVQLAFDQLARGQLRASESQPDALLALIGGEPPQQEPGFDPVAALERRIARMVLGGRRSLTTSASRDVAKEAEALRARLMPTASRALEELLTAAASKRSALTLLEAWTRVYVVAGVVGRRLS